MSRTLVAVGLVVAALACSAPQAAGGSASGGRLSVVVAENFWGSIAEQLGGSRVLVQTVVSDPNADPHEYESSANDARAFAAADLVILNGAGYDRWGQKLLAAGQGNHRRVLTIADALGRKEGDNPHFWYDPAAVVKVADRITSEYRQMDSSHAAYYDQQRAALTVAFKPLTDRVTEIRQRWIGSPIGATENVIAYLAAALGLNLITDPAFMQAVAEGNDPPAGAVASFQDQIARQQIRVLIYNVQTATAVTTDLRGRAEARGIPVVGVSETLRPEGASFQDWQLAQLVALEKALAAGVRPV
jgi:zinc/manganese transport system substrate-binding protein